MAIDLSGIENIEFYSGHYLDAVLEGDLKDLFKSWQAIEDEGGPKAPFKRFNPVAGAWEKARKQVGDEPDPVERWRAARRFHAALIEALGYPYEPDVAPLEDDTLIPLASRIDRDGRPYLWVVDAPFPLDESAEALDAPLLREQYPKSVDGPIANLMPASTDTERKGQPATWRELLDTTIFRLDDAPRWVLFMGGNEVILCDRHKWPAGRFLRFDLGELFSHRSTKAMQAFCALAHRDSLAPKDSQCLHDKLEENSHKHAFAVSGDLKHGVRRAVELLANEAVWYRREVQRKGVFNEEDLAKDLERDCLTWLYRLLFLFYVEARGGELGVVPMKSDAYREGYSLEGLRDLELVPLTTAKAREGYYIDHSLKLLFRIVNEGFPGEQPSDQNALPMEGGLLDAMRVSALHSPLFDEDELQVLKGVKFRNQVLQEILQLMSLSAPKRKKSRGRISYAQLGINQLGAVYEGLLSYTGFFATEDLYEVAAEKDCKALSGKPAAEREALKTYFVPASKIGDYKEGEIVKDENERKVVHKKGSFIFRLAGRNREKSASYYTPEVLTQCLVKYSLKELLWEEGEEGQKPTRKKTADEILALTICEPAMGSSAFLIEAVDQLADAYLDARQEELEGIEELKPEDYQREKRRVKARLATNNCYGVDLNPTAVELAKVSLWLATLHEDGKCPWFGLRLAAGNSLVGARREVFKTADVTRKGTKDNPNWLGLVPKPVPLHHGEDAPPPDEVDWANWTAPPRPKGTIYHFLLPAEGMAAFDKDKVIKQLAPESVKRIKEWRKEFCKPFNKSDAERLEQISDAVDRLFAQVVRERVLATQETSDRIPVWGESPSPQQADLLVRDQEEVAASLEDGSSAYRRLKLAMDAWCALWFWPIEEAGLLPDRATWLAQMELILKGQVTHEATYQQANLFGDLAPEGENAPTRGVQRDIAPLQATSAERLKRLQGLSDAFRERRTDYFSECGLADVDGALTADRGLAAAQLISNRLRFHHWTLRFAEVFAQRGGFDLTIGNPPWLKLEWNDLGVLSDGEPKLEIRSSCMLDDSRAELSRDAAGRAIYFAEIEETVGLQSLIGDLATYPFLHGQKANLYKCFLLNAWSTGSSNGITAFLHMEGVYDDRGGGSLRKQLYRRLRYHFQFANELKWFEIGNQKRYSFNVSQSLPCDAVNFTSISNLLHPRTIDDCFVHDGRGAVPGVKDEEGHWDLSGHRDRLISVDDDVLTVFRDVYETSTTAPRETRLPVIHSVEILEALACFMREPRRLADLGDDYFTTYMFDEGAAKRTGLLLRKTGYAEEASRWIIQGPHIFVGDPLYQTPNEVCDTNRAYTRIDLCTIPDQYLPRTNYVYQGDGSGGAPDVATWRGQKITDFYRVANRRMAPPTGERSLVSAIIPPGSLHVHAVMSTAIKRTDELLLWAGMLQSLPYDFFIKTTGSDVYETVLARMPFLGFGAASSWLVLRVLVLNCLTEVYAPLWRDGFAGGMSSDSFCRRDRRLLPFGALEAEWSSYGVARSELERRQGLLEIDVLVAQSIKMTIDQLVTVYRSQFSVLRVYERERLFDQHGRVVSASQTASGNPAVSLVELAATLKEQAGFDVHAEYHPDGSNTQELRKQKIRLGKKEADVLGVSERCTMADLLAETEVRWSDEDHPEGRPVRLVGLRYTDPGLEPRMERVYPTPWTRCDREADYRQAWAEFERRLNNKD